MRALASTEPEHEMTKSTLLRYNTAHISITKSLASGIKLRLAISPVRLYLPMQQPLAVLEFLRRKYPMKIWNLPVVREQEVGLEVTSYLAAEIDLI